MKKITVATVKGFIKKNAQALFVNVKSSYDGMVDGIQDDKEGFQKAKPSERVYSHSLGIMGVWFTPSTRNWCEAYEDNNYTGFRVDNCCGSFIVGIHKEGI